MPTTKKKEKHTDSTSTNKTVTLVERILVFFIIVLAIVVDIVDC